MVSVKQRWNPIVNLPKTPKAFSVSLEWGPAKPNKEKEVRNLMLFCYEMYEMYFLSRESNFKSELLKERLKTQVLQLPEIITVNTKG